MLGISQLEVVPGSNGAFILTSNFGHVDTYGFDLGFIIISTMLLEQVLFLFWKRS
jgi:hypothetical protein